MTMPTVALGRAPTATSVGAGVTSVPGEAVAVTVAGDPAAESDVTLVFEPLPAETWARSELAAWSEVMVCAEVVEGELAPASAGGAVPAPAESAPVDPFDASADGAGAEAPAVALEPVAEGSLPPTGEEAVPGDPAGVPAAVSAATGVPEPLAGPLVTGAVAASTGVVGELPGPGELVGTLEGPAADAWVVSAVLVEPLLTALAATTGR